MASGKKNNDEKETTYYVVEWDDDRCPYVAIQTTVPRSLVSTHEEVSDPIYVTDYNGQEHEQCWVHTVHDAVEEGGLGNYCGYGGIAHGGYPTLEEAVAKAIHAKAIEILGKWLVVAAI